MFRNFLVAIFSLSAAFAGDAVIGIATASGHFNVASSQVWGNATLFEGAAVETGGASSELALRNGVKVQLGASSKARVFANRAVLERGTGQVAAPASYEIDAAGLRIDAQGARVRVGITDRIEVVSFSGAPRVMTQAGVLLAAVPAGRAMSFAMQAGSSGIVTRTGCLLYKDGHFILQDENTQEVAELRGSNLAPDTGNRVTITGTASPDRPSVSPATLVVNVTVVKQQSAGGCLSVASLLGAKTEAPSGAGAASSPQAAAPPATPAAGGGGGLSAGAKTAIIVGIAGGAGAGAAIALAGKKSSTSP